MKSTELKGISDYKPTHSHSSSSLIDYMPIILSLSTIDVNHMVSDVTVTATCIRGKKSNIVNALIVQFCCSLHRVMIYSAS